MQICGEVVIRFWASNSFLQLVSDGPVKPDLDFIQLQGFICNLSV